MHSLKTFYIPFHHILVYEKIMMFQKDPRVYTMLISPSPFLLSSSLTSSCILNQNASSEIWRVSLRPILCNHLNLYGMPSTIEGVSVTIVYCLWNCVPSKIISAVSYIPILCKYPIHLIALNLRSSLDIILPA